MVYSKAKYRANTKYNKKAYKDVKVRIRKDNEQDMLSYLSMKESINEYIKELIKEDMKKNGKN